MSHDDFMREHLRDYKAAVAYFVAALEDGDEDVIRLALRRIAEAAWE